jgi:magnesium-transporting ATPase (P-type)
MQILLVKTDSNNTLFQLCLIIFSYTADIPPAMALGVEPEEIGLMKRKPRNPKQGVLTKVTWIIIFVQSMLIALLTIGVYVISLNYLHYKLESAQSLVTKKKRTKKSNTWVICNAPFFFYYHRPLLH